MSHDIECQLLKRIKSSPYYSIQLDKSIVIVKYFGDANVHDDLLFCKEPPIIRTTVRFFVALATTLLTKLLIEKNV